MVCDGVPEAQHLVAHCTREVSVREFMPHAHLDGTHFDWVCMICNILCDFKIPKNSKFEPS
jgi:hypothetical protein